MDLPISPIDFEPSEEAAAVIRAIEEIIAPLPHCLRIFRSCVCRDNRHLAALASHDPEERKRAMADKRSRGYQLREFTIRGRIDVSQEDRDAIDREVARLVEILTKDHRRR